MSSGYSERINIKKTIVDNSSPQILTLYVAIVKTMDNRIAELKKQIAIVEAAVKAASDANLNYVKQNAENTVATAKADAAIASASLVLELSVMNTSHLYFPDIFKQHLEYIYIYMKIL